MVKGDVSHGDLGLRIITRLRRDPDAFSRNRNFYAYTDPVVARARRLWRHLRALEADLHRAGETRVTVHPAPDGEAYRVVVRLPHLGATRMAYVTRAELDLLREEPRTRAILEAAYFGSL
jgi:hypothetical protein